MGKQEFPFEIDDYSMDQDVNECQIFMYFSLIEQDKTKQDEIYKKFEEAYNKLDDDKKEYIKKDFIQICERQDEIQKEQQEEAKQKKYSYNKRRDIYE